MKKSDISILVIDDDQALGTAFKEALKLASYQVDLADTPDKALTLFGRRDYQVAIVDCMLPKTNGVQLATQLKEKNPYLKVILTSGIFNDRVFIKDAIGKTNAKAFLSKPIELSQLLELVGSLVADDVEPSREGLPSFLIETELNFKNTLKRIQEIDYIEGYEVPLLYTLLFESQFSGVLTLTDSEGRDSMLWFQNSQIQKVLIPDSRSFFGALLIEQGFSSNEEVQESLAKIDSNKPIGERLIDANALSPHAVDLILFEQAKIRLGLLVRNQSFTIHLDPDITIPDDLEGLEMSQIDLTPLISDWCFSKTRDDWLNSKYRTWMDNPIVIADGPERLSSLIWYNQTGPIQSFLQLFNGSTSLQEIIDAGLFDPEDSLRMVHSLLVQRLAFFQSKKKEAADFESYLVRLQRIHKEQETQDHFEVLGVGRFAKMKEVNQAYIDLAKLFHPDRLSPEAPEEVKNLCEKVFTRISTANDILSNESERRTYVRELETGKADNYLKAESLFDEARELLRKSRYPQALEKLQEIKDLKVNRSDMMVYFTWAKIKVGAPKKNNEKWLSQIKKDIKSIPPEDRHAAPYMLVKALFYSEIEELGKAHKNLMNALAIDPTFNEAKKELVKLRARATERGGQTGFVKIVGEMFGFGGKKKSA